MKNLTVTLSFLSLLAFSACGQVPATGEDACKKNSEGELIASDGCKESETNPPLPGTPDQDPVLPDPDRDPASDDPASLRFPHFSASWGLKAAIFDKAVEQYNSRQDQIVNKRYVVVVDFSQHSSKRRFYLFDLLEGKVESHAVSHGQNSDKNYDGWAESFSNVEGSLQSSLGFYVTLSTYQGKYGYSMRLSGKDSTNSKAQERAIVVHPATYVKDSPTSAGRSWGCPALDPKISTAVINKIKNGAMFYIGR
jgi:hypothetical protein